MAGQRMLPASPRAPSRSCMNTPNGLDDKDYAAFAWGRYRAILKWMTAGSFALSLAVTGLLEWYSGPLPWLFLSFTFAGVFGTLMMAAALMGLIFLSNGSGHDESVNDFNASKMPSAEDWEKEPG